MAKWRIFLRKKARTLARTLTGIVLALIEGASETVFLYVLRKFTQSGHIRKCFSNSRLRVGPRRLLTYFQIRSVIVLQETFARDCCSF